MAKLNKTDFDTAYRLRKAEQIAQALLYSFDRLTPDEVRLALITIKDDCKTGWLNHARNDEESKTKLWASEITPRMTPGSDEHRKKAEMWREHDLLV